MSIYIFEPGGGSGSTPNLQQVLIAGSGLSQSNSINTNSFSLSFLGNAGPGSIFSIGTYNSISIGNGCNSLSLGANGSPGLLKYDGVNSKWQMYESDGITDNFFVIDPNGETAKIGFYATNLKASIRISGSDINYVGDEARFTEANSQAGNWSFDGTDGGWFTDSIPPTSNSDRHLIVYINGNTYYIQLREPTP